MLEQAAVSRPQTDDGGLLLPLKAVDRVLPTFWDGVECPFDAVFVSLKEMGWMLWLL